jgi:hypothetical protein
MIRIFAVGLNHPAPARIAGEIHDRRVKVSIADRLALPPHHGADPAREVPIPRRAEPEVAGEIGRADIVQPADALVGEIDGNAETRLLDEPTLDGVERVYGGRGVSL